MSNSQTASFVLLATAFCACASDTTKTATGDERADAGPDATRVVVNNAVQVEVPEYRSALTVPLGMEPMKPVVASLNDDERPDIVVVHQFSADAVYLLGEGNGAFRVDGDTIDRAIGVVAADFDGNGLDDLALSVDGEPRIEVVLNAADLPFQLSVALPANPDGLLAADFDSDQDLDLAASLSGNAAEPASSVALLRWNGTTFDPETLTSVGLQPRQLALFGERDLVVLLGTTSAVQLTNDGNAGFAAGAPFSVGEGVLSIAVTDLDQSGTLDVIAADLSANQLTAALDVPTTNAAKLTDVPTPFDVTTADLNGDDIFDIITTSVDDASVVALVSDNGTYVKTTLATLPGAVRLGGLVAADADGDGIDDLFVAERGRDAPGTLHVLLSSPLPVR